MLIGVISDTHGPARPEAARALAGVSLIIHAGDVGTPDVLKELRGIAPVVAVRGNTDTEYWARGLRETEVAEAGDVSLYVLHDLARLDLDPGVAGFGAVISGHTHRPLIEERNGILFLNPGSAGPRRSTLPVSLALIRIRGKALAAEIVGLVVQRPGSLTREVAKKRMI